MKKIIILFVLIFWLISCWNTHYKDLSEDEKTKIQASAIALTFKEFWKALKWKESWEKPIEEALKEKYPDIDFGDFSELEEDMKNWDWFKNIIKNVPMF